jgi:hypothetical protein
MQFDADQLHSWALQMPEDSLPQGWDRVSRSASTRVAVQQELGLYYKEFRGRSPAASLRALAKGSRATRARTNSEALLLAGIDAPEPLAWGDLPGGHEYVFTAAVPGIGVAQWLRDNRKARTGERLRLRRQMLHALGTFIGRVHATGFIHGNLQANHILVALQQEQFRFTLIDNERIARKTPAPGRLLLRDLTKLNNLAPGLLNRTDRMRFFRAWRRQMRELSAMEAKILAAEAYHRALRRRRPKKQ